MAPANGFQNRRTARNLARRDPKDANHCSLQALQHSHLRLQTRALRLSEGSKGSGNLARKMKDLNVFVTGGVGFIGRHRVACIRSARQKDGKVILVCLCYRKPHGSCSSRVRLQSHNHR